MTLNCESVAHAALGEPLKREGAELLYRCPHPERHTHGDTHPSFKVNPKKDTWGCFVCGVGGTAWQLAAFLGCLDPNDKPDVTAWLRERGLLDGDGTSPARPHAKTNSKPNPNAGFRMTDHDVERMREKILLCQQYIENRGISLTVAGNLRWGYSQWTFGESLEPQPALAIPHYVAGKLAGVKYRTIDGSKLFSQNRGSTIDGLYGVEMIDVKAAEVSVYEGPEDVALALSYGFNATGIIAAGSKLGGNDVRLLARYERIYLVGDQDAAGQKAMDALHQHLPAEQVIRVRMASYKDVGDLWKASPAAFPVKLRRILRFAQGSRDHFQLEDLLDENEITQAEDVDRYAVEKLVPCYAISMFFGEEKSGKSLLSRYIGKCVANELKVFEKYPTRKMAVLCLDLENNSQDIRAFTTHFARLGPGKIRYRTRQTGVPALDSPALLHLCESEQPLIILDSMTKFLRGANPFHPGEMSIFFDKLLNLCAAGATIFLIHHATRADVERYANSHQIGANVARAFAVVSEDRPYLNRIRLEGQLFRGAEPVTENLVAFPLIAEAGIFGLNGDVDSFGPKLEKLLAFVKSQPGQACSKETIKKRSGMRAASNLELLDLALKRGLLIIRKDRKVAFPNAGTPGTDDFSFPDTGTGGNVRHEN